MNRFVLMSCFVLLAWTGLACAQDQVIARKGWDYDRADLQWPKWSDVSKEKKKGTMYGPNGFTEFDVEIPKDNWYALWIAGVPVEWSRNLYVDGKPIFVESIGTRQDTLPVAERRKKKIDFKEINLYLTAGKHQLRFERLGFPGVLPSRWELRPATGQIDQCIAGTVTSQRVIKPGESIQLEIVGGASEVSQYQLILTEQLTGKVLEGPRVDFPASDQPVTKKVTVILPEKGLYLVTAKTQAKTLRPADMKIGYVMAAPLPDEKTQQAVTRLSLNGLFTDRVVLQRDKPLPIWGQAPAGQGVTVNIADQTATTTADVKGDWKVTLKPMSAGGPHKLQVKSAHQTITRSDVKVGEVWLLSGQSNMGGPLLTCIGGKEAAGKANDPDVRLGFVHQNQQGKTIQNVGWMRAVCPDGNSAHLKRWLGIHFAFGTELHDALNIPIGLIAANRGGTYISTWTPESTMKTDPAFKPFYDQFWQYNTPANRQNRYLVKFAGEVNKWKKKVAKLAEGAKKPTPPKVKPDMPWRNRPGQHYAALIKPIAPFAIRGVLWYQGESDSKMAAVYLAKFQRMVSDWCKAWGEPNLPFITVQISYGSGHFDKGEPGVESGAEMRQMQIECAKQPDIYMVASHDLMRPEDNVHYLDKLPVGHRLALAARKEIYGQDVVYQGPMFHSISIDANKARLHFQHTDGGLKVKGDTLNGFSIAGKDQKWHWAKAKIEGDTVGVSSSQVSNPVAVRYGWSGYRNANLFNGAGLPAPTFRTDDWPLASVGITFKP